MVNAQLWQSSECIVATDIMAHLSMYEVFFFLFRFQSPGYSNEMKPETLENYEYPNGAVWQKLFAEGKFQKL